MAEQFDSQINYEFKYDSDFGPSTWFEIASDNSVTFHCPKVEMGQGIHTALAQVAAEELRFDWNKLKVISSTTTHGPIDPRSTGGSDSVTSLWNELRTLAAEMREMLLDNASVLLNIPVEQLQAENGVVSGKYKSITYGEIVKNVTKWETSEREPVLKTKADYQFVGKSLKRVDIEAKVKGEARFGIDGTFPGMLYGAFVFPSVLGATFKSAEPGKAASLPGVIKVIIEDDFAAVVAETRTAALLAKHAIEVEWNVPKLWKQKEIDELVRVGAGDAVVIQDDGDVEELLENEPIITANYSTPMAIHGQLEPNGAVAWVRDGKVTIMMSTQVPAATQEEVAKALDLNTEDIEIIPMYLGGGFGRRLHTPHAVQIAKLSKAVGRPVHVFFERKEEFQNGYLRPPTQHLLKGKLTGQGSILAFEHNTSSGDVAFPIVPSPIVPGYAKTLLGADIGAWRGGRIFYSIENKKAISWRAKLPVYTSWWRGLGLLANTFALESFMDELAYIAKQDPYDFRMKHLGDSDQNRRIKGVLEVVAEKTNWRNYSHSDRALGIACSIDVGTAVALVAEVSVVDDEIKVHKITGAIDPGLVINPDGVKAQCEGGILMALSSTLYERIYLNDKGELSPTMYGEYPILTMRNAPEIEILLVGTGDEPRGVGEPPMGPVGASVANALFKLTGKRLRELPLKPVKENASA